MPAMTIDALLALQTLRRRITTSGKVVGSMVLLSVAAPSHGAVAAGCERAFCRCVPASMLGLTEEQLVRRRLDHAERVVLGRVVRTDTLAPRTVGHGPDQFTVIPLATRVRVVRVWKGAAVDTLTVVAGTTGIESSCDLALEPGESYVVFASRGEDGLLYTRQCTGTASERDAAATISLLGTGQEPKQ
jgi:hypothetical protein